MPVLLVSEGCPASRVRPILVVEDNPMDLDFLLQAFAEHDVTNPVRVCRDGEEALHYIATHVTPDDPDLPTIVLLDLRLPKVDGLDVLRAARLRPVWNQVPFIVVTTSRENADIGRAYELGANAFLVKPVDFASFSDVVRNVKAFWLQTNQPPYRDPTVRKP